MQIMVNKTAEPINTILSLHVHVDAPHHVATAHPSATSSATSQLAASK
jgi:hypothetical protein